jgi:glycerophosphoryl diester phosphodiesterase
MIPPHSESLAPNGSARKINTLTVLAAAVVILVVAYQIRVATLQPVPSHPVSAHQEMLVMAHRGGRGLWPENTLYAFRRALALGADALDFDIHGLNDGTLVVLHDDTVDRTTNGSGAVRDFALSDLQKLDAGYRWTMDDGRNFPFRGQGITIPTLAEVFIEFPRTRMNIEIKDAAPGIHANFCRLIHAYAMEDRVTAAAFSTETIRGFRAACPGVATAAATGEVLPFYLLHMLRLGRTWHPAAETLQIPAYRDGRRLLTERLVQTAHAHGMKVYAWTINDVNEMRALLAAGVDGIITDYPERLLGMLGGTSPHIAPRRYEYN